MPNCYDAYFANELKKSGLIQPAEKFIETQVRQLTYDYTCQFTALYGAQKAYGSLLDGKSSLVIHVVGARMAETLDLTRWEIFFHWLPDLQSLTTVFIGPELR